MYQEKLAVAIKHNGRVLREHGDIVYLPFGAEYSVYLKNLDTVRAVARITVDGMDATEGTSGLIVPPNSSIDLERFIKSGNLGIGNRFKFVERTQAVENGPRGVRAEDGLIRIEFEFERPQPAVTPNYYVKGTDWQPGKTWQNEWYKGSTCSTSGMGDDVPKGSMTHSMDCRFTDGAGGGATLSNTVGKNAMRGMQASATTGITVPGSVSDQTFTIGDWFPTTGIKHAMILRLMGTVGEAAIAKPITVHAKPRCVTCGHQNRATAKFCTECGTSLELVIA